jgi:broad specificity phosphatase PhoE
VRLFLVRHGEPERLGCFYGHHDLGLSPRGRAQMEAVAARLAPEGLAAVYTSDLVRAADGARLIAAGRGLTPVADPRLREMHLGCLEGLGHEEAARRFPELVARPYESMLDFRMPEGGESFDDVWRRAAPLFAELRARHADEAIAVVAHQSVNRLVLGEALGLARPRIFAFAQDYGCLNVIDYRGERTIVRLLNGCG